MWKLTSSEYPFQGQERPGRRASLRTAWRTAAGRQLGPGVNCQRQWFPREKTGSRHTPSQRLLGNLLREHDEATIETFSGVTEGISRMIGTAYLGFGRHGIAGSQWRRLRLRPEDPSPWSRVGDQVIARLSPQSALDFFFSSSRVSAHVEVLVLAGLISSCSAPLVSAFCRDR